MQRRRPRSLTPRSLLSSQRTNLSLCSHLDPRTGDSEALDSLRERVIPVIHIDHAARLKVPAEEDTRIRKFPHGQLLWHCVITRRWMETLGLKKSGNDAGTRSGVEHMHQQSQQGRGQWRREGRAHLG